MSLDAPITVMLDRPRRLRWSMAALVRLGRLERPPAFSDLLARNAAKSHFALCAFLWAGVEGGADDFPEPESIAEHLDTEEKVAAALAALLQALRQAGVLKTSQKKTDLAQESAASIASNGPMPSSSSAPPVRLTRR